MAIFAPTEQGQAWMSCALPWISVNGIDVDVAFQQFGQPVVDGGSECGEFVQARPNEGRRRSPELPVAVDLVTK